MASTSFEVKVAEAYILTTEPAGDPMLPPPPTSAVDPFEVADDTRGAVFVVSNQWGLTTPSSDLAVTAPGRRNGNHVRRPEDPNGGITLRTPTA